LMPAPPRYTSRLPQSHEAVMEQVRQVVEARGLCVIDHTGILQGDENYYDTDHLNRTGAEAYVSGALADVLQATDRPDAQSCDRAAWLP